MSLDASRTRTFLVLWVAESSLISATTASIVAAAHLSDVDLMSLRDEPYSPGRGYDEDVLAVWRPLAKSSRLSKSIRCYKTSTPNRHAIGASLPLLIDRRGDDSNQLAYFDVAMDKEDYMVRNALQDVDDEALVIAATLMPAGRGWPWRSQWIVLEESSAVTGVAWSKSFLAFACALLANLVASAAVTIWFFAKQPRAGEAD